MSRGDELDCGPGPLFRTPFGVEPDPRADCYRAKRRRRWSRSTPRRVQRRTRYVVSMRERGGGNPRTGRSGLGGTLLLFLCRRHAPNPCCPRRTYSNASPPSEPRRSTSAGRRSEIRLDRGVSLVGGEPRAVGGGSPNVLHDGVRERKPASGDAERSSRKKSEDETPATVGNPDVDNDGSGRLLLAMTGEPSNPCSPCLASGEWWGARSDLL